MNATKYLGLGLMTDRKNSILCVKSWIGSLLPLLFLCCISFTCISIDASPSQQQNVPLTPLRPTPSRLYDESHYSSLFLDDILSCKDPNGSRLHFLVRQVPGDGSCLFHAVGAWLSHIAHLSDQQFRSDTNITKRNIRGDTEKKTRIQSIGNAHFDRNMRYFSKRLRDLSVDVLQKENLTLWVEEGETMSASHVVQLIAEHFNTTPDGYYQLMRDGAWGGGPEVVALSNHLRIPIHVYKLVTKTRFPWFVPRFELEVCAKFGSPAFDFFAKPIHILCADGRYPHITPGEQKESGDHFLALFPCDQRGAYIVDQQQHESMAEKEGRLISEGEGEGEGGLHHEVAELFASDQAKCADARNDKCPFYVQQTGARLRSCPEMLLCSGIDDYQDHVVGVDSDKDKDKNYTEAAPSSLLSCLLPSAWRVNSGTSEGSSVRRERDSDISKSDSSNSSSSSSSNSSSSNSSNSSNSSSSSSSSSSDSSCSVSTSNSSNSSNSGSSSSSNSSSTSSSSRRRSSHSWLGFLGGGRRWREK